MAEREGFEPSLELAPHYRFSKPTPSASWVPLLDATWRKGWDSNPRSLRLPVFKTGTFNRSVTLPNRAEEQR
jgi:hypothetical protein